MPRRPVKRRWSRWVEMSLAHDLRSLCLMARAQGLAVISAHRPGLCAWEALALWGTAAQVGALESHWDRLGLRWHGRRPRGAWDTDVDRPREQWAETTVDWSPRGEKSG